MEAHRTYNCKFCVHHFLYGNVAMVWIRKMKVETNQLHEAESLGSRQSCSYSRMFQHFMEPEGSNQVHRSPTLVPILSNINLIRTIQSYLSKIHFSVIHLPIFLSYSLFFLLAFPPKCYIQYSSPHSCYVLYPSHRQRSQNLYKIVYRNEIAKFYNN
jgi:hypothetical protein